MAYLKRQKEGSDTKIKLDSKRLIIGREETCDIVVSKYENVSREHCGFIKNDKGDILLIDYGSRNGTFLNGKQVFEEKVLREGDLIKICDGLVFSFHQDLIKKVEKKTTKKSSKNDFQFDKGTKAAFEMDKELEKRSYKDLLNEIVKDARPKGRKKDS